MLFSALVYQASAHPQHHGAGPSNCTMTDKYKDFFPYTFDVCTHSESHLHHSPRQELFDISSADECAEICKNGFGTSIGCQGYTFSVRWQKCFLVTSKMFMMDRFGFEGLCTGSFEPDFCTSTMVAQENLPNESMLPLSPVWPALGSTARPSGTSMSQHLVSCDPLAKFNNRLTSFFGQEWLSPAQCSTMCHSYSSRCAGSIFLKDECVLFEAFTFGGKCKPDSHGLLIYLRHCDGSGEGQAGPCQCATSFCPKGSSCKTVDSVLGCYDSNGAKVEQPEMPAEDSKPQNPGPALTPSAPGTVAPQQPDASALERDQAMKAKAFVIIIVAIIAFVSFFMACQCLNRQRRLSHIGNVVVGRGRGEEDFEAELSPDSDGGFGIE